jgi:hypothetical protein
MTEIVQLFPLKIVVACIGFAIVGAEVSAVACSGKATTCLQPCYQVLKASAYLTLVVLILMRYGFWIRNVSVIFMLACAELGWLHLHVGCP